MIDEQNKQLMQHLTDDFRICAEHLASEDSPFWHRTFFRTSFSMVGGDNKVKVGSGLESRCARKARLNAGESPAGAIRRFSTEDRANCVAARRGGEQAWSRTGRSQ